MKRTLDVIEEIETSTLAIELLYGQESAQMHEAALVIDSCHYSITLSEALTLLNTIIERGTMWTKIPEHA